MKCYIWKMRLLVHVRDIWNCFSTLANYIVIQMIAANIEYLGKDYIILWEEFKGKLVGDTTGSDPHEDCLDLLNQKFSYITGKGVCRISLVQIFLIYAQISQRSVSDSGSMR